MEVVLGVNEFLVRLAQAQGLLCTSSAYLYLGPIYLLLLVDIPEGLKESLHEFKGNQALLELPQREMVPSHAFTNHDACFESFDVLYNLLVIQQHVLIQLFKKGKVRLHLDNLQ